MPNRPRSPRLATRATVARATIIRTAAVAGPLCAALCAGLAGGGCQEAATAAAATSTATAVVQATAAVAQAIPEIVQQAVDLFQSNNPDWGKPERIVVTDTTYVFLYPTTAAQRKKNGGVPRMFVYQRPANEQRPY